MKSFGRLQCRMEWGHDSCRFRVHRICNDNVCCGHCWKEDGRERREIKKVATFTDNDQLKNDYIIMGWHLCDFNGSKIIKILIIRLFT